MTERLTLSLSSPHNRGKDAKVLLKKEAGHTGVLCEGARLGPELPRSDWPMPLPVIPREWIQVED